MSEIELMTHGRISLYFLIILGFKIYFLDTVESYVIVQKECPNIFNWFVVNIGIILMNFIYAQVGRGMRERHFTYETNRCYKLLVMLHGLVAYIYGMQFAFKLNFNDTWGQYFDKEQPTVWHQYITFKLLEIFRFPLLLGVNWALCCCCIGLALSLNSRN